MHRLQELLASRPPDIDIVDLLRGFFLLSACTILGVNNSSLLRNQLVSYGARSSSGSKNVDGTKRHNEASSEAVPLVQRCVSYVASWKVPHSYFTQFYVVSVASSFLWGTQLALRGSLFQKVSSCVDSAKTEKSMTSNQLLLCWALLTVQGSRRLYENISLAKPSVSRMSVIHWLLGLVYYVAMGIAVWIEGIGELHSTDKPFGNLVLSAPSLKTIICIPIFMLASGIQHDCHCYLASLEKYTLPVHPAFLSLVCPHYTAECAIYTSLCFLAAPKDEIVNKTLLSGLVFVVVNLGVSAGITKKWYMEKFGKENVQRRRKMIPFLY